MKIVNYRPEHKQPIIDLSLVWLKKYEVLEPADMEMLNVMEDLLTDGGCIFVAVDDKDQVIGTVMLENLGDSCEMLKLGVAEHAQGQGIGRRLIELVIETARAKGMKKVVLCTNHRLLHAIHLYESVGFRHVTYEANHFEMSDISMELDL